MPRKPARKPRAKMAVKGRIVFDTGPLLDIIIVSLGLTSSCKDDSDAIRRRGYLEKKLDKLKTLLEDVKPASVWPVFTEAIHLLNSRCNLSKRCDYPEKLQRLKRILQDIEEINVTMHESLEHIDPGRRPSCRDRRDKGEDPDLADAALIALSAKSKLYNFITNDSALKSKLRSKGAHTLTLWELLSLIN